MERYQKIFKEDAKINYSEYPQKIQQELEHIMTLLTKNSEFEKSIKHSDNKTLNKILSQVITKAGIGSRNIEEIKHFILDKILKKYYNFNYYK